MGSEVRKWTCASFGQGSRSRHGLCSEWKFSETRHSFLCSLSYSWSIQECTPVSRHVPQWICPVNEKGVCSNTSWDLGVGDARYSNTTEHILMETLTYPTWVLCIPILVLFLGRSPSRRPNHCKPALMFIRLSSVPNECHIVTSLPVNRGHSSTYFFLTIKCP